MSLSRISSIFKLDKLSRLCCRNLSTSCRPYSTQQEIVMSFYDDKLTKYAENSVRPVTFKELIRFGQPPLSTLTLLKSANYTRSALPVRLARRVKALQNLPFIVGTNPYV